jgi:hypothetical protein
MPIDDEVRSAMLRWPTVPAMHGWLRLTRRGRWMLIDRGRPGFDEALHGAGSEITSPPILDFIGRNYLQDETGAWHWQNGPQRVFVDLDLAPLYFRVLEPAGAAVGARTLITHTGYPVGEIRRAAIDAHGNLWLETDLGPGCLDDRDLAQIEIDLEAQPTRLSLMGDHEVIVLEETPAQVFGFVAHPRPACAA